MPCASICRTHPTTPPNGLVSRICRLLTGSVSPSPSGSNLDGYHGLRRFGGSLFGHRLWSVVTRQFGPKWTALHPSGQRHGVDAGPRKTGRAGLQRLLAGFPADLTHRQRTCPGRSGPGPRSPPPRGQSQSGARAQTFLSPTGGLFPPKHVGKVSGPPPACPSLMARLLSTMHHGVASRLNASQDLTRYSAQQASCN